MKAYHITAIIDATDFNAENKEEARKLFWDSISDKYGIASSVDQLEIEEQKELINPKEHLVLDNDLIKCPICNRVNQYTTEDNWIICKCGHDIKEEIK